MNIEWDKTKAKANERKHGVSFADAAVVLSDPLSLVVENDFDGEQRFQAIGEGGKGQVLSVVFTYRGESHRIISARMAEKWERNLYEG